MSRSGFDANINFRTFYKNSTKFIAYLLLLNFFIRSDYKIAYKYITILIINGIFEYIQKLDHY